MSQLISQVNKHNKLRFRRKKSMLNLWRKSYVRKLRIKRYKKSRPKNRKNSKMFQKITKLHKCSNMFPIPKIGRASCRERV